MVLLVFPPDSTCPVVLWNSAATILISPTRLSLSMAHLSKCFDYQNRSVTQFSTPFIFLQTVWAPSLSLATTQEIEYFLSFPPDNEMFQFSGFPSIHYFIRVKILCLQHSEFPHSEVCGSKCICHSPQLIAACHVLHRRLMPRHPPYALCSLIVFLRNILRLSLITLSCYSQIRNF